MTSKPRRSAQLRAKMFECMSETQASLLEHLWPGNDVTIDVLYCEATDDKDWETRHPTFRQHTVGAYFGRMNKKLKPFGWCIRPGQARRTYRLYYVEQ